MNIRIFYSGLEVFITLGQPIRLKGGAVGWVGKGVWEKMTIALARRKMTFKAI